MESFTGRLALFIVIAALVPGIDAFSWRRSAGTRSPAAHPRGFTSTEMPPIPTTDVAIIGGGVIGSAIAYFLAAEAGFRGSITVLEPDPGYRRAASALSVSSIRQQFSTPVNIAISRFGIKFLRQGQRHLEVEGEPWLDFGLVEQGYLFLAEERQRAQLTANHRLQQSMGAAVALLTPAELAQRFPALATDDLAAGALGLSGEGWFDGYALLRAFRRKARALGVTYVPAAVVGTGRLGRSLTLALSDGGRLRPGVTVIAAGPQSGAVAKLARLELPVEPRKRSVFVFAAKARLAEYPLIIDPGGVYVRPEGERFLAGVSPPPERDPPAVDFEVDHALFDDIVWPALARRIPAFAELKLTSAWAGHYDYNRFDQNGLVGPLPGTGNWLCATGFSGHGLQQAPAIGRGVAELIAYGRYRSLDLSPLDPVRVAENKPLRELNLV